MTGGVVGELNQSQMAVPIILALIDIGTQGDFQGLVHPFGGSVRLGMVSSCLTVRRQESGSYKVAELDGGAGKRKETERKSEDRAEISRVLDARCYLRSLP
jgi:hypothetical protein